MDTDKLTEQVAQGQAERKAGHLRMLRMTAPSATA